MLYRGFQASSCFIFYYSPNVFQHSQTCDVKVTLDEPLPCNLRKLKRRFLWERVLFYKASTENQS